MSQFLNEIKSEIRVRIRSFRQELVELEKPDTKAARIKELKALISEAESELKTFCERCPDVDAS